MHVFKLPENFLIGTANSAFQSEGALDRDGRSPSVMDYYAAKYAGQTPPNRKEPITKDIPDRGCYFYDNYEAYIDDMVRTGQNTFRLSIAWSRVIPTGFGEVNPKGLEFYGKVIDKLLSAGIKPMVDLNHWDLPQCLVELGGYENENFPQWFEDYARVCFEAFGDRVPYWSTVNESSVQCGGGYLTGTFPPFRKDLKGGQLACHRLLLGHYRVVRLYKSMSLPGKIGAVNHFMVVYPGSTKDKDKLAAQIRLGRQFEWWAGPMLEGKYPEVVLENCPEVLANMPENFRSELAENFVPMDFIGCNYYYARYSFWDENSILKSTNVEDFYAQPDGFRHSPYYAGLYDLLMYIKERHGDIEVMITENGLGIMNDGSEEAEQKELNDDVRCEYIREHLRMISRAIDAGVNVTGYYYWNDADSYEELVGYDYRFGLTYVDRDGNRTWKKSRHYFSDICRTHIVP
ncbi:MAG: family 1 glycosylhydrolase [Lachnospiraceae bacterium]|nr:family 1 glycosylhydrolase [Lachnospiraceae bacterium]